MKKFFLITAIVGFASMAWADYTVQMNVSAYCPCEKCCGEFSDGYTASGYKIQKGDRFAAAPRTLAFGTKLRVPGYANDSTIDVRDRGGAIKGNRLDLYFDTHREALEFGRQQLPVTVIQGVRGDGTAQSRGSDAVAPATDAPFTPVTLPPENSRGPTTKRSCPCWYGLYELCRATVGPRSMSVSPRQSEPTQSNGSDDVGSTCLYGLPQLIWSNIAVCLLTFLITFKPKDTSCKCQKN
jgi:3D (Asp-Asp-Asp) domain-containing protein